MQRQDYNWQRFWCPTTGNLRLDTSGFLYDPESEYGKSYNPDLVKFDGISNIPCLILLGEAGIGKTTAIEQEYNKVKQKIEQSNDKCLRFNLIGYDSNSDLRENIFKNETLQTWLNGTHKLYLFLDSLDEGLLSLETIAITLEREIDKLPCDRLYFRITCRTADWKHSLTEKFQEKWGEKNVAIYELAPLRKIDVVDEVKKQGIDENEFFQQLLDKEAVPLAIKPITLKFILKIYVDNSRFPSSKKELYEKGCLKLCTEVNPKRNELSLNQDQYNLSEKQRLILTGRIAAITIFTNKVAIWDCPDFEEKPYSDIWIQDLCVGKEKIDGQEFDITKSRIKEVFSISGLFYVRENRIGFAHKTYAEFLAAWYLTQHEIPLVQIMSLIVSPEDSERKLIPQLHETAAWLASMRSDVSQKIINSDPDVLLKSDVPEDVNLREALVSNLLEQYEQEKLFNRGSGIYSQYRKLKHPKLANQLKPYIKDYNENFNARYEAIKISKICEVKELQDDLVDLALDRTQQIYLRSIAASTIASIGDSKTRLKLKPLAVQELPEDKEDRLKGYALKAIWRYHLTAKELFDVLAPPKRKNFLGGYQSFIERDLVLKLNPDDILVALNWLEKQGVRCFGHPFEKLGDKILLKAWNHFDNPKIVENFVKIALIQWEAHQRLITNSNSKENFDILISRDDDKRRKLIENSVVILAELTDKPSSFLSFATEDFPLNKDIFWMLDKINQTESQQAQKIWSKLIEWNFNRQKVNPREIDAIIIATQSNNILYDNFKSYFIVDLDSSEAERQKSHYFEEKEYQENQQKSSHFNRQLKDQVIEDLLLSLESGNLDAWWLLNQEMIFYPYSNSCGGNQLELDLTRLPVWQEKDIKTRNRIIYGAKKYISEQDNVVYDWIGTSSFNHAAISGVKALNLLLLLSPEFIESLDYETWKRWSPVIVAYPNGCNPDLVKSAYLNTPHEMIDTLLFLIDKDNETDYLYPRLERFKTCWDDTLNHAIFKKVKDISLKPELHNYLLQYLLQENCQETHKYVESFLILSQSRRSLVRKIRQSISKTLIKNANPEIWTMLWPEIQKDEEFWCEVLENIAADYSPFGLYLNLTEKQLADLYMWFVQKYSHHEYPNDDDFEEEANERNLRQKIANFRDNIVIQLKEKGTKQACREIQLIAQQFPELTWLKITLFDTQINRRTKTWQPPKPAEIFKLVRDRDQRLVNDGNELLEVLIESLKRLELELQGKTPAARDVWDQTNLKPLRYKPNDENTFSSYVKRFLDRDLTQRGIIANREVELRPSQGGAPGERTDIHVDAVIKNAKGEVYDSITVIIEVKGCWHKELNTAMETQLVNRYLQDNTCQHGLYLVGWFNCNQWDDSDSRKRKSPTITIEQAKQKFDRQAQDLSRSDVTVQAFVLNSALR